MLNWHFARAFIVSFPVLSVFRIFAYDFKVFSKISGKVLFYRKARMVGNILLPQYFTEQCTNL